MSDILCPQCHAPNRSNARFCSECGASLGAISGASPSTDASQPAPSAVPAPSSAAASSAAAGGAAPEPPASEPAASPQTGHSSSTQPAGASGGSGGGTSRSLLERYRIEDELGRGGFGAVYNAWDNNLSRRCAVKENLDTSTEAQRQFSREATVLANLSHPNLPRVTDHFTISGQGQYLVMDFVEGEDLASLLAREHVASVEQAVDWISQVADAVSYLHSRQPPVLHRDIKPANIRITPEGKVMLVDFGLVKMYDPLLKTTMGARAVTPGYAPPEQYGMGRTDSRSDIYALGATLYKLLTGKEPMESVQRATGGKMPPAQEVNPKVSPAIGQAIEKAMALDPNQRFQSALELKAAIQAGMKNAFQGAGRPGGSEDVLVARGRPVPAAAPAISAPPAGRSKTPGGMNAAPSGMAPARPAGSEHTPGHEEPAAGGGSKGRPMWIWVGLGGLVLVVVLCLGAGGGLIAMLNGSQATATPAHTPVRQNISTTTGPEPGQTQTPVAIPPVASVEPQAADAPSDTPAVPTVVPTTTPDPRFLSKDPSSFVFAGLGLPDTLDTALDYETSGMSVLHNIYETLIWYNRESPVQFIPQLALEVPSLENGGISADGKTYTFKIRPEVRFHDGSPLTVDDVVYSFQRGILQGGSASPQWLFTEPLMGVGVYDVAALIDPKLEDRPADLQKADPGKLQAVCQQVTNAITADPQAGTVTFHLAQPWGPFLGTLANGWSAIRSKAWTISNGGWDGSCATWQKFYGRTVTQLNKTALGTGAMGTGPFKLDHWTQQQEIVLKANEDYWRTQPAWAGGPSGAPRIKTVTILYKPDLQERLAMLKAGQADAIDTESNTEWSTLDQITGMDCKATDQNCQPSSYPEAPLEEIHDVPLGNREQDITFNWQINTQGGNDLLGSGKLDGAGIPADFFANVHVRRAFAYCFNYDRYLKEVLQGEGIRPVNLMLPGMIGYDPNSPYYTYNLKACEDEFRQAEFNGKNVWDTGFRLSLPYGSNSTPRMAIAKIYQAELTALNGRFQVDVREVSADDYGNLYANGKLPYTTVGWVEDVHDPHNWVYPYTLGSLGHWQIMPADLTNQFQQIISRAVQETDPEKRAQIYQEFNQLYYDQAPAVLMFQVVSRHYQQRWVNGWYGNPLFPGMYYYVMSKN